MSQVRRASVALISVVAVVLGFAPSALALSAPRAQGRAAPSVSTRVVRSVAPSSVAGYWLVAADGSIFSGGAAGFHGSTGSTVLNRAIVGMASTPSGHGYWIVASDGGVFSFGDAVFHGSTGAMRLNKPIVGMASTPTGDGYWMVASDGGVFSFGDAAFHGSTGAMRLNKPIVGMTSTLSGNGYTLVASDGGIFSFGDAHFHGSTGALSLKQPIVGIASSLSGNGYWMVASDGGVFSFGDAHFHGSMGGLTLTQPIVGMAVTPTGNGYWFVAGDGVVFAFGDAHSFNAASVGAASAKSLIVGIAASAPMAAATPPVPPAAKLAFTIQPSPTATGGTEFAIQPSVTVQDATGATVASDTGTVTLAITAPAGGATVTCTAGSNTAVAGVATFAGCNIDKVGTYTLTATDGSLTSAESTAVDVTLGAADHLAFTNSAFGAVVNGGALVPQPRVTIEDAGGNVVPSASTVTLSANQAGGTLACTSNAVVASAGVAAFAGCTLTGLAASYTLHGAVGVTSVTGTSGTVALSAGIATHLAFTNTAFGAAVNATALTAQPRVAVEDISGNTVAGPNSITLSVTGAPAGVVVACTTNPVPTTAGVATFAGCNVSGPAATYTLHATNGTITGDSGNVTLAAFGAATHLVFTNAPLGTVLNGAAFAPQPQVTVEDAANNVVTSANTITLSVNGGIPTLACTTNPVVASSGVATFAGCNLIGLDATYTLHATNGTVTGDSGNAVLATGPATHLVFTNTAFGPAVNGAPLATQPVVMVEDAGGNIVTTPNSITLSVNGGVPTLACTTNPFATVGGVATFAGCNLIGLDATYTLHATNGTVTGNSGNVVLGTGPATHIVFTNTALGTPVDGVAFITQPVVTVEDAGGNTVTTPNSITLSVNGGIPTLACTTNPLATASGVATFAGCKLTGTAATYTLHATNGTFTADSGNVVLATGPATHLVFSNGTIGAAVNGGPLAAQPIVTVEDIGGNTVTTANSITLSVTGAPAGVVAACTTNPVATASGVATFAGCKVTGPAATYAVHATNGTVTADSNTFALAAFGPATHLVFTQAPVAGVTSGTNFSTQPIVTVEDAFGNTVTNDVTPILLKIPAGATLACALPGRVRTPVAGVATWAGCNITGSANTYTISADNGLLPVVTADVVIIP